VTAVGEAESDTGALVVSAADLDLSLTCGCVFLIVVWILVLVEVLIGETGNCHLTFGAKAPELYETYAAFPADLGEGVG